MSLKLRTECIKGFLSDLRSGKYINHQPNRTNAKSKWYYNQPDSKTDPEQNVWG